MIWGKLDLSRYMCAAAPFGGPIALIQHDKRIVAFQGQSSKPIMHIYSSSGRLLNQIQVSSSLTIVGPRIYCCNGLEK
jgi:hypothetical protein